MKAILVIDMPHCCHDCICADWDQCLCKASNREIYSQEYMNGGRQAWCPIKPMLTKMRTDGDDIEEDSYWQGWNDCLKEIENEQINKSIQEKEEE